MKVLATTLLVIALVALVASRNLNFEDGIDLEENTAYGYHRKFGIPLAKEIREAEALGESTRIAGGTAARLGAHPYQAGIIIVLTSNEQSACGGSILNSRRVLTAAHCWWDGQNRAREFVVVVGSLTLFLVSGGQRQRTSNVVTHANWNPSRGINDIAMVNLNTAFSFSNNVNSIALPSGNELNSNFAGAIGTVTGYGRTSDTTGALPYNTVLRSVPAPVISNSICQQTHSVVTANNICTRGPAGRSPCPGDSGGPLVVYTGGRNVLIGVVSFGSRRCTIGDPVAYTRVTSFISWINSRL